MYKHIIEIELECSEEQLPAAIQQVAQVVQQAQLPGLVRQVFIDLPETSQIAFQIPNLTFQKVPLLENKHDRES